MISDESVAEPHSAVGAEPELQLDAAVADPAIKTAVDDDQVDEIDMAIADTKKQEGELMAAALADVEAELARAPSNTAVPAETVDAPA
ncbi:hypothetical protein Q5752_002285 [Cryptotrichosporon argae]